jgi:hypothetical protein
MFVLLRLFIGLVKGLILGGLIGYGIAAIGFGAPGALVAYLGAAVVGMLVALVAGKPIWVEDARIEVGMKAAAGATLAPGLMWLSRHFLTMGLPFDAGVLPGLEALQGQSLAVGTFAVTSLALVAAVLAGFFDADNQPKPEGAAKKGAGASKKRIAAARPDGAAAEAEAEQAEAEVSQRRRES